MRKMTQTEIIELTESVQETGTSIGVPHKVQANKVFSPFMRELKRRLKKIRIDEKMGLKDGAEIMDISTEELQALENFEENGQVIDIDMLARFARAYGYSLDDITFDLLYSNRSQYFKSDRS